MYVYKMHIEIMTLNKTNGINVIYPTNTLENWIYICFKITTKCEDFTFITTIIFFKKLSLLKILHWQYFQNNNNYNSSSRKSSFCITSTMLQNGYYINLVIFFHFELLKGFFFSTSYACVTRCHCSNKLETHKCQLVSNKIRNSFLIYSIVIRYQFICKNKHKTKLLFFKWLKSNLLEIIKSICQLI